MCFAISGCRMCIFKKIKCTKTNNHIVKSRGRARLCNLSWRIGLARKLPRDYQYANEKLLKQTQLPNVNQLGPDLNPFHPYVWQCRGSLLRHLRIGFISLNTRLKLRRSAPRAPHSTRSRPPRFRVQLWTVP